MHVIDDGITRFVLVFDRHVIKMPRFWWGWFWTLTGLLANINEAKGWKMTEDERLCPVLWADPLGFFLVMPRCEPVKTEDLPSLDSLSGLPSDYKTENFGRYKGRVVLFDYAG